LWQLRLQTICPSQLQEHIQNGQTRKRDDHESWQQKFLNCAFRKIQSNIAVANLPAYYFQKMHQHAVIISYGTNELVNRKSHSMLQWASLTMHMHWWEQEPKQCTLTPYWSEVEKQQETLKNFLYNFYVRSCNNIRDLCTSATISETCAKLKSKLTTLLSEV
jgi:hypothetical protein